VLPKEGKAARHESPFACPGVAEKAGRLTRYVLAAGTCSVLVGLIVLRWSISILGRRPAMPSDFRIPLGLAHLAAGLIASFCAIASMIFAE
jgi:hypothetical protein